MCRSFGLAITTIAYNAALKSGSAAQGVILNEQGSNAPRVAQFPAYKDAMWGGFAFGALGASRSLATCFWCVVY